MKKETAEKLLRERFDCDGQLRHVGNFSYVGYSVACLCDYVPAPLRESWRRAWKEMNTEGKLIMPYYLSEVLRHDSSARAMLRLLTIHLWLRHDFAESPKKKTKRGKR